MTTIPPQQQPGYAYPPPPPRPGHKFGGLAWTALILGIVGIVGSPVIFLNNLTAVIAAVGVVLGGIALFGTRKVLAAAGAALSVLAIVFTVIAQDAAVKDLDKTFGDDPDAAKDVTVSECAIVDNGYGYLTAQSTVRITNSADTTQTYLVTVSVNDPSGARVGEIHASSSSLASGQSVTLSGMDASGTANEGSTPGPAGCTVASADRFPS